MSDLCIQCGRPVTNLQHAVTCDRCDQWQHRTCDTGISLNLYRQAVSQNIQISFLCKPCQPLAHPAPSANDSLPILEPVLLREVHTPDMVQRHDDDPSILDTSFDISRSTVYPYSPPRQSPYQSMCEPSLPRDVATPVLPPKPSTTIDDPIEPLLSRSDDLEANVLDTARIESSFRSDSDLDLSDLDSIPDEPITYKVLEWGSQRGAPRLVSSDGYSYTIKARGKQTTSWRCSVRSKTLTCPATVRQVDETFQRGICNPARDIQTAIQEVEPRRRWLLPKFPTMFRAVNRYRATTTTQNH